MKITYTTEEDTKRELLKDIQNLSEDQKSKYIYNDEYLYKRSHGHDFLCGFYVEFLTKSGTIIKYQQNKWSTNNTDLKLNDFVLTNKPVEPTKEYIPSSEPLKFPTITKISASTISQDLIPVAPMNTKQTKY